MADHIDKIIAAEEALMAAAREAVAVEAKMKDNRDPEVNGALETRRAERKLHAAAIAYAKTVA